MRMIAIPEHEGDYSSEARYRKGLRGKCCEQKTSVEQRTSFCKKTSLLVPLYKWLETVNNYLPTIRGANFCVFC